MAGVAVTSALGSLAFVFMLASLVSGLLPSVFGRVSYIVFAAGTLGAVVALVLTAAADGETFIPTDAVGVGLFVLNLMLAIGIWERNR